jgi:hypothetical protein
MRLLAFCEAPADFRLTAGLVDRVLREQGPSWVADNFEMPEVIRVWHPDPSGRAYFDLHALNEYMDRLSVPTTRGHFNGRPGGAGSSMMRKALKIVRALSKRQPDESIDAVVLVWDMDQQPDDRRAGMALARDEARRWAAFQIVCGFQDPEREAWILAGFDPCDEAERALLAELHDALGFSPVVHAARLRDKSAGAARNIKRVLGRLTRDDPDREERCWTDPPLATLRERGGESGLAAFLDEIENTLLPLLDPRVSYQPRS